MLGRGRTTWWSSRRRSTGATPRSPTEITADALDCVDAGASIVQGNRAQVEGAAALLERLGRRPATPAEARGILGVPPA